MAKKLLINLFKTFVIATVVSIAAICIFYSMSQKTHDYGHVVNLVSSGAMLLNIILLVMSLPSLFISQADIYNKLLIRLLFYFSGALVFIITSLLIQLSKYDRVVYLFAGVIFTLIHAVFYYRFTKKHT